MRVKARFVLSAIALIVLVIYYLGWYSGRSVEQVFFRLIWFGCGLHLILAYVFKWTMYIPGPLLPTPENKYFRLPGVPIGVAIILSAVFL
jgi:hypothetical protein